MTPIVLPGRNLGLQTPSFGFWMAGTSPAMTSGVHGPFFSRVGARGLISLPAPAAQKVFAPSDPVLGWIVDKLFKCSFHDTKLSTYVSNAYHALAIDERRWPFRPTLWQLQAEHDERNTESMKKFGFLRYEQKWFPGVHGDVGGGHEQTGLSDSQVDGRFRVEASITWNYTTWLNIGFLLLAALLVWRFVTTGGFEMLRIMNRPARGDEAHHHSTEVFSSIDPRDLTSYACLARGPLQFVGNPACKRLRCALIAPGSELVTLSVGLPFSEFSRNH